MPIIQTRAGKLAMKQLHKHMYNQIRMMIGMLFIYSLAFIEASLYEYVFSIIGNGRFQTPSL